MKLQNKLFIATLTVLILGLGGTVKASLKEEVENSEKSNQKVIALQENDESFDHSVNYNNLIETEDNKTLWQKYATPTLTGTYLLLDLSKVTYDKKYRQTFERMPCVGKFFKTALSNFVTEINNDYVDWFATISVNEVVRVIKLANLFLLSNQLEKRWHKKIIYALAFGELLDVHHTAAGTVLQTFTPDLCEVLRIAGPTLKILGTLGLISMMLDEMGVPTKLYDILGGKHVKTCLNCVTSSITNLIWGTGRKKDE